MSRSSVRIRSLAPAFHSLSEVGFADSQPAFGFLQGPEYRDLEGNLLFKPVHPQFDDGSGKTFVYHYGGLGPCRMTGATALKLVCQPFKVAQTDMGAMFSDQPYIVCVGIFSEHRFVMDSSLDHGEVKVVTKLHHQVSIIA